MPVEWPALVRVQDLNMPLNCARSPRREKNPCAGQGNGVGSEVCRAQPGAEHLARSKNRPD